MPRVGLEPTCPEGRRLLRPLPIPIWAPRRRLIVDAVRTFGIVRLGHVGSKDPLCVELGQTPRDARRGPRQLGRRLGIADYRAAELRTNVLRKLGVRDRLQAVIAAYDAGLVQPRALGGR